MGADIYLKSVNDEAMRKWKPIFDAAVTHRNSLSSEKAKEKAQKSVEQAYDKMFGEGYFRDSYNGTSVLQYLGLSWWRDVIPMLKDGAMPVHAMVSFRALLLAAIPQVITIEWLKEQHCSTDESIESWTKFFEKKRNNLIKLLDRAIELHEPLEMSL